eukprot:scaffold24645_cov101-Isochrysis_galbana.AAC.6
MPPAMLMLMYWVFWYTYTLDGGQHRTQRKSILHEHEHDDATAPTGSRHEAEGRSVIAEAERARAGPHAPITPHAATVVA